VPRRGREDGCVVQAFKGGGAGAAEPALDSVVVDDAPGSDGLEPLFPFCEAVCVAGPPDALPLVFGAPPRDVPRQRELVDEAKTQCVDRSPRLRGHKAPRLE